MSDKAVQSELLSPADIAEIEAARAMIPVSADSVGVHTGELMRKCDPQRYDLVESLLCDGRVSQKQIAVLTHTSRNTVAAIYKKLQQDPERVELLKRQLSIQARTVAGVAAEVALERLINNPDDISTKDLSVMFGIFSDKSQVLSGAATSIVEHKAADVSDDDYEAMLARAKRVPIEAECEVVSDKEVCDGVE